MAGEEAKDGNWSSRTWVGLTARPTLVDYSGLSVRRSARAVLTGQAGYRPIALLIAALFFAVIVLAPIPGSLTGLVEGMDLAASDLVGADAEVRGGPAGPHANPETVDSSEQVARRAMVMLGILLVAAILWGTEGLPIGGTVILVAVLMLAFGI
jgi:sodium-dependent dicarboxylate transporter 2/3/5